MTFQIAEKFVSPQGEGVHAGTMMAFIRFVGCSVGKKICHHCDTDFDKTYPWMGGGEFTEQQLADWVIVNGIQHVCFTGGEPLDQDPGALGTLIKAMWSVRQFHFETSGTRPISPKIREYSYGRLDDRIWICVSPKPGYIPEEVEKANEIKVIVPGLGNGDGWPGLEQATAWAMKGIPTFIQPRNKKNEIDRTTLQLVQDIQRQHPSLRLSLQLHKLLAVR